MTTITTNEHQHKQTDPEAADTRDRSTQNPTESDPKRHNHVHSISAIDLVTVEKEIQRLIGRKIQVDRFQLELESRIYQVETEYLRQTCQFGSILTGLDGYLGISTSTNTGGPHVASTPSSLRKSFSHREIKDSDRMFSNTSSTSRRMGMNKKTRVSPLRNGVDAFLAYEEDEHLANESGSQGGETPSKRSAIRKSRKRTATDSTWATPSAPPTKKLR